MFKQIANKVGTFLGELAIAVAFINWRSKRMMKHSNWKSSRFYGDAPTPMWNGQVVHLDDDDI